MAGVAAVGRFGKIFGKTGLDKVIGPAFVGLAVAEAAKNAVINPGLEMAGLKKPSYVPPPAMSQYEEIMLGQQQQPGFFGIGGQQRTQGLIEKRAFFDMEQQRERQRNQQAQQINQQVMSDRIARMQIQANSPLELTRTLADRDKYAANQSTLSSMSAAMANSMTGNIATPNQIGYSQTSYAPSSPTMNFGAANYAVGQMRGGRGGRYGTSRRGNLPPGMPMTPELQDQMQLSKGQMGQFSGPGGAIARGYNSPKFGYVGNSVPPEIAEWQHAMGQPVQASGRRRRGIT